LLSLSIPPPTSNEELPQTIENLKKKKAYFVAVQPKVTQDAVAKAEAEIKKLEKKLAGMTVNGDAKTAAADEATADAPETLPPNGTGEKPAEPASTPAVADSLSIGVPTEVVGKELEAVKEDAEEGEEAS